MAGIIQLNAKSLRGENWILTFDSNELIAPFIYAFVACFANIQHDLRISQIVNSFIASIATRAFQGLLKSEDSQISLE